MTEPRPPAGTREVNDRPAFPISVVMERRQISRGNWSWPDWRVHAVIAARSSAAELAFARIDSETEIERYLWTGLTMRLHRDAAENYWQNLQGQQPSMFVVCRSQEEEASGALMAPFLVTADQYEAEAYMEGDDTVFAVPIPADVYGHLERFVMDHYRPSAQRKRKRNRWSDKRGQDPSHRH